MKEGGRQLGNAIKSNNLQAVGQLISSLRHNLEVDFVESEVCLQSLRSLSLCLSVSQLRLILSHRGHQFIMCV